MALIAGRTQAELVRIEPNIKIMTSPLNARGLNQGKDKPNRTCSARCKGSNQIKA